jgi:hypothetical protein
MIADRTSPGFEDTLNRGKSKSVHTSHFSMSKIDLYDALKVCHAMRDDPVLFDRAAARWVGRFALEGNADLT